MKMLLAFFTTLLISQVLYANICIEALSGLSIEQVAELETFGPKGYKSHLPLQTPQTQAQASNNGLMWWDQRVYIVSSKEEAIRHHDSFTQTWEGEVAEDPLMFSAYVIINNKNQKKLKENLAESEKLIQPVKEAQQILNNLLKQKHKNQDVDNVTLAMAHDRLTYITSLLEDSRKKESEAVAELQESNLLMNQNTVIIKDFETQKWVTLPETYLNRFTNPKIDYDNGSEGVFLRQVGWVKPTHKGVIVFSEMDTSTTGKNKSKRITKIKQFSRKLKREGFTISINDDMESVILAAKNQKRKGQSDDSGARFTDDLIATYVEGLKEGKTYSLELRAPSTKKDEKGELVAGTFGKIHSDGTFYGESVFYPENQINYAKVAVLHLIDLLNSAGHTFMDAGMVTPFTRSGFYGQYVTSEEFTEKYSGQNEGKPVDLETPWEPDNYEQGTGI